MADDAALLIEPKTETSIKISVCAVSNALVKTILDHSESLAPKRRRPRSSLDIRIWHDTERGPDSIMKNIHTPSWTGIARNYPVDVAEPLDGLMRITKPINAGRLILWHGEPGTGKTTALRALIRSWQGWCSTHYIADPERLFADTRYLLQVVGSKSNTKAGKAPEWQLIVAEDSDEYLRVSARKEAGAALGRLLNLADGILGQGSNTLILLTTNERLDKLHPALVRPGRCLAQIEYKMFSASEAAAWLPPDIRPPAREISLAELIEMRSGSQHIANGIAPVTNIGNYL